VARRVGPGVLEQERSIASARVRTLDLTACNSVTVVTELSVTVVNELSRYAGVVEIWCCTDWHSWC